VQLGVQVMLQTQPYGTGSLERTKIRKTCNRVCSERLGMSVTLGSPGYGQGPLGPADIRSATGLPPQPLGPPGVPLGIWG